MTGVEFRALQVLKVKLEHAAMLPLKTKSDAQVYSVWRVAYAHVCPRMLAYALLYMLPLKTKSDAQVSHRVVYASVFSLLYTVLQYAAAVPLKRMLMCADVCYTYADVYSTAAVPRKTRSSASVCFYI